MVKTAEQTPVPTKKPIISVVVSPELKTDLEKWAEEEGRTVSNLSERILSRAIREWKAEQSKDDEVVANE